MECIVLGGGCFWCIEAVFRRVDGIIDVVPGYSGGWKEKPTYQEVCSGTTGHAEVVKVLFDPKVITLEEILNIFFAAHDPTSLNRQGNDVGEQYRSIILYTDEEQLEVVKNVMEELKKKYSKPIVTQIKKLDNFYPAEKYHWNYFDRNKQQPYCRYTIAPKIERLAEKGFIKS